ncbi:EF-hand domain-containing protein [Brevundimonas sp. TSRC1-1]|uniref:EF-hand domain-containing protein n=1 Tax=Brevundimonas sp. TSRC1-1 TaxID=2804562 RepID=UPI003CF993DE
MNRQRPLKKSETVEIRLPHATKTAFMDKCRIEGRTASEAIRRFIDSELDRSTTARSSIRMGWRQLLAAAFAGLALGAVAAPSLAQSVTPDRAAFNRLDRDHDGMVSFEEFRAR